MLVITWLYVIGALAIALASGTALPRDRRKWFQWVFVLAAGVAVQLLLVNTTAWGASQELPIWIFVGIALAYPAGLLLLGGIAYAARRQQRLRRIYLCIGMAVPIYLTSTLAGMAMGCATDLECMRSYPEIL